MGRLTELVLGLAMVGSATACVEPGGCREASRTAVIDPSAPLHIGGTLADVRATLGGTRSGRLQWLESELYVRGFPPPGQTEITVSIAVPDVAWEVDAEPFDEWPEQRLHCPDHLEVALELELRTDDGVLDASVAALVALESTRAATLRIDLSDEDRGNLPWAPFAEDARLLLVLSYGSRTGPTGALRLHHVEPDGSGELMIELARWTLSSTVPERDRPQ